jgi:hypothetical protein
LVPPRLRSGFSRSASAYYCRFCLANKYEATYKAAHQQNTYRKLTYRFSHYFMTCSFCDYIGGLLAIAMAASELTSPRWRSGEWVA